MRRHGCQIRPFWRQQVEWQVEVVAHSEQVMMKMGGSTVSDAFMSADTSCMTNAPMVIRLFSKTDPASLLISSLFRPFSAKGGFASSFFTQRLLKGDCILSNPYLFFFFFFAFSALFLFLYNLPYCDN